MRVPLTFESGDGISLSDVGGMHASLRNALVSSGFEMLFPVQCTVWEATAGGSLPLHDICLAAPTGSGKTLAYALPILQSLCLNRREGIGPRGLIVLPTRDLALQVDQALQKLADDLGVTCFCACGKASLRDEAKILTERKVDLLIATPGRLVAHMEGTPEFNLRHLQFLVVDEADRLLRQSYHGWLEYVINGPETSSESSFRGSDVAFKDHALVKFIVSATLTRDPSKLGRFHLKYPRYVAISTEDNDYRHKLPEKLKESKFIISAEQKPLLLVTLLKLIKPTKTIVFSSSLESTHRLALMLRNLEDIVGSTAEYSAAMSPETRCLALQSFRDGKITTLVSSDAMTRGMDVEQINVVINYDAPVYLKTYIHRAGRTARAGRTGKVITLLRPEDVRHFRAMLKKAENSSTKDEKVPHESMKALEHRVNQAIEVMRNSLTAIPFESSALRNKVKSSKGTKRRKLMAVPEIKL